MNKKRITKIIGVLLNILIALILIWSIFNYNYLKREVTETIQIGGLLAMVFFVFILEGAPIFVGPSVAIAALLPMGIDPLTLLYIYLIAIILSNFFYYYIGYFAGRKVLGYFDKKDVKKYEDLFGKYGRYAMFIMAISPIPYLPTIAGVFKMNFFDMFVETLAIRIIRHIAVFAFWYLLLI